jgi:hypothetical protein
MWQYNYTAIDNSDYLKHYKYIRKEIKNGHTYYIYDDSEYKQNAEKADSARKIHNQMIKNGYTDKYGNRHIYNEFKIGKNKEDIYKTSVPKQSKKDIQNESTDNAAKKVYKEHDKQVKKDRLRKLHAKGLAKVSDILRRLRKD